MWLKLFMPMLLWSGYAYGFEYAFGVLGPSSGIVGLVLGSFTAWLWGGWVGALIGLPAVIGHTLLLGRAIEVPLDWTWILGVEGSFVTVTFLLGGVSFAYFRNLSGQLRIHKEVSDRAQYDDLTGLLTRAAFVEKLKGVLEGARKNDTFVALLFVDLDRFKFINDTYGHEMGDELLKAIANGLRDTVRDGDLVARMGGDEFTVALPGLKERRPAEAIASKLVRSLNAPFKLSGKHLHVSASIGVSLFPEDGEDIETLLKSADSAMYEVKEVGKNNYNFSTIEMRTRQSRRLQLERRLHWALQEDELKLFYQPQFDLRDGKLLGFEALLRWESRDLGWVQPQEFVPVAEEAGMIVQLGHWVLREACQQERAWQQAGYAPVKMSVNVSALQFRQPNFLEIVARALRDSQLDPQLLEIEVTETVFMQDSDMTVSTLRKLAKLGVKTVLDDFGTGYSSLAYLQRLPIATLKLDREFVSTLRLPGRAQVGGAAPIIEAICLLARKLQMDVIAEGVETEGQRRFLVDAGCHYGQGFLFAKPLPPQPAEQLLRRLKNKTGVVRPEPRWLPMPSPVTRH
jgi:diguanylate cyclase (GGDEF)-like protein